MKSQIMRLHAEFVKDIMAAQALFYQSLQKNVKNHAHQMYENHRKQGDFRKLLYSNSHVRAKLFFFK